MRKRRATPGRRAEGERFPAQGAVPSAGGGCAADALDSEEGFGLVEALIALIILGVGLLAIAGIALSVSAQARAGVNTTAQVLAGQQVLEAMVEAGYGNVPTTDTTVTVGNRTFTVRRSVTATGTRWQQIEARVEGMGDQPAETLVTRLHEPRTPPTSAP